MKVLLVSTNKEMFPLPVAPIGVTYLAATLRKEGYIVKTLDLCFLKHIKKELAGCIKSFNPDIIGISVRNLDNSTFIGSKSYLLDTKGIVDYIKINSKALLVVGGTGFSSCPSSMLKYLGLCYGIIGEGEEPLLKLVQCVEKKGDIGLIPGIIYLEGEKIIINKKPDFGYLDNLPKPAWDLIMCDKYMKYGGYGAIQTKRGCKFDCIYCSYPILEGDTYRYRSPQAIVDEMQEMKEKSGIKYFYFVDSVFSFPEHHARAVCEEIIRRNLNIGWVAMTNPRSINIKLVKLMKRSGCIGVEVGIDSGSKDMLEKLQKRFTKEDITYTARLYTQAKIPFSFYLLLGGPGETSDTIQETVNFLKKIDKPNQVLFNFGIRVYAGTQLEMIARSEGVLGEDEDLLVPKHYLSKDLDRSFLKKLDEYCSTQYHWSNATDWNSPTTILLQKMGQKFQIRPLWKNAYIMGLTRKLKRFYMR